MNIHRLIFREIAFRKLSFLLGVCGLVVAVACFTGALALLRAHDVRTAEIDQRTEEMIAAQQLKTAEQMRRFEDETRKHTLKLGFNMMILPKGQKFTELYDEDALPRYMPEDYALKLAEAQVATINHVLPSLIQRVKWPEIGRNVTVMGVRGEVYVQSQQQKPLLERVPEKSIVIGYDLHHGTEMKVGQTAQFMGRPLTISRLMNQRGNNDDATVWINLAEAQEILGRIGLINCILALECACDADRLPMIRKEVSGILPDTDVVEFASQAITRSEMRMAAAVTAEESVKREKARREELLGQRDQLREKREGLAAILIPSVAGASAIWIALLMMINVRERREEIGILRALGVSTGQVLWMFLGKAVVMGVVGAAIGFAAGQVAPMLWRDDGAVVPISQLFSGWVLVTSLATAPMVAVLAGWVPAFLASQQDPATVLQQE